MIAKTKKLNSKFTYHEKTWETIALAHVKVSHTLYLQTKVICKGRVCIDSPYTNLTLPDRSNGVHQWNQ